jgi:hypothetical protein
MHMMLPGASDYEDDPTEPEPEPEPVFFLPKGRQKEQQHQASSVQ